MTEYHRRLLIVATNAVIEAACVEPKGWTRTTVAGRPSVIWWENWLGWAVLGVWWGYDHFDNPLPDERYNLSRPQCYRFDRCAAACASWCLDLRYLRRTKPFVVPGANFQETVTRRGAAPALCQIPPVKPNGLWRL